MARTTTERVINWCEDLGVKQLTLYSFSTENFKRTDREKKAIFDLVKAKLRDSRESPRTHTSRLRITCVGDIDMLPEDVRQEIQQTDDATSSYDNYYLNIALAYGGRKEIVDGAIKMAEKVKSGELSPEDMTEETDRPVPVLQQEPPDRRRPDHPHRRRRAHFELPALGGQRQRVCHLHLRPYWPEFRKVDFMRAIRSYQLREREHRIKYAIESDQDPACRRTDCRRAVREPEEHVQDIGRRRQCPGDRPAGGPGITGYLKTENSPSVASNGRARVATGPGRFMDMAFTIINLN